MYLGEYSEISFIYGENTDIYRSCSVTYKNNFYLFGGLYEKRQVLKIRVLIYYNSVSDQYSQWMSTRKNWRSQF